MSRTRFHGEPAGPFLYDETVVEGITDTDERSREVFLSALRNIPAGRKVEIVLDLTEVVLRLAEAGVRQLCPGTDEREVFLRPAARRLDRETMLRVYGWAPEL